MNGLVEMKVDFLNRKITTDWGFQMIQRICEDSRHEYVKVVQTTNSTTGNMTTNEWYQCKFCGKIKEKNENVV